MNKNSLTSGMILLIIMFSILCVSMFSVLTVSIFKNEVSITREISNNNKNYSKANEKAEEILFDIINNENIEDVVYTEIEDYKIASYSVNIDENKILDIEVEIYDDGYKINKWQQVYIGEWKPETHIKVWTED